MKTFVNSHVFARQCVKRAYKGMLLILLSAVFLFSCKQTNKRKVPLKDIVITLQGDSNVILQKEPSITVVEGSKWRDIYSQVKSVIKGYKEGWEEGGFRLRDVDGEELERYSEYEFNSEVNVYAFAKQEMVSIYVNVDEGYTLIGDDNIKVGRFSLWKDVKNKVEALVQLHEDYNADCWKVLGDELAIEDDRKFEADSTTIEACSKIKDEKDPNKVTLTVSANEGFDVAALNTLRCHKQEKWEDIKDKAYAMLTLKEKYIFVEWRKNGETGSVLDNSDSFSEDTTVFAIAKKEECSLSIMRGEGYRLKDAGVFKIEKDSLWKDIKESVEKKIEVLDEYKVFEWRVDKKDGDVLQDDYKFSITDKTIYLYPISRKKNISITVRVDIGHLLHDSDPIIMPNPSTWKNIREEALKKIELQEYYDFVSWHMDDGEGEVLEDESFLFWQDASIFAKTKRQKVNITVRGEEGCNIVDGSLTILRGSLWKDVKNDAKDKLGLDDEFYEVVAWHLVNEDNSLGEKIEDDYKFLSDQIVRAITKKIEVSISIKEGSGYRLIDPSSDTIIVEKGDRWQNVKDKARAKIKIDSDWEFVEWHLLSDGSSLADNYVINIGFTVFAKTKLKDINVIVRSDDGFYLMSNNIIRVPINTKWKDIKTMAESKVSLKQNYKAVGWRLMSLEGPVLQEDYVFRGNTIVYAISTEMIKINIKANYGYIVITPLIEVPKGSKWKDVYIVARECVELRPRYQEKYWRLSGHGTLSNGDYEFTESNVTLYAVATRIP